jgi:hypothetical protein
MNLMSIDVTSLFTFLKPYKTILSLLKSTHSIKPSGLGTTTILSILVIGLVSMLIMVFLIFLIIRLLNYLKGSCKLKDSNKEILQQYNNSNNDGSIDIPINLMKQEKIKLLIKNKDSNVIDNGHEIVRKKVNVPISQEENFKENEEKVNQRLNCYEETRHQKNNSIKDSSKVFVSVRIGSQIISSIQSELSEGNEDGNENLIILLKKDSEYNKLSIRDKLSYENDFAKVFMYNDFVDGLNFLTNYNNFNLNEKILDQFDFNTEKGEYLLSNSNVSSKIIFKYNNYYEKNSKPVKNI